MKPAVAIIPARGGSKGIPRKNIRLFCGKPLIAWTIEAARSAETIREVYVSTDDDEIAEEAMDFGAKVIYRPPELATDDAPSELAVSHAIANGARGQVTAFLQCTSPLMLPEDIDGCVRKVLSGEYDSCFTATPFEHFVWKEGERRAVYTAVDHDPENRPMRQKRERRWVETGACYAFETEAFFNFKCLRFFGRVGIHEVPKERSIEIDNLVDWELAETLMMKRLAAAKV